MKDYFVTVTQEVLNYLENVKKGKDWWSCNYDSHLTLNESLVVQGYNEVNRDLLLSKDGELMISIPARLFPEFDIETFVEELRKEQMEREREEQRKKFIENHDWDSLRIDIAVKMLQSLASKHSVLMDEINTPEELAQQHRITRKCVYTAVRYADELINELINGKR